jgi:hypothetical protein
MPIPQFNDRIKEAPVVMLRAVFAGIGQILLAADKVRARAAEQVVTPERAVAANPAIQTQSWQSPQEPRNGTPHGDPAVTRTPSVRDAAASQGTTATKATTTAKTTPAAKTTPRTKSTKTAKSTTAAKATKRAPAARTAPVAKNTTTPAVAKTTKTVSAEKTGPALSAEKTTKQASAAKAAKTVPDAKAASAAKATPAAKTAPAEKAAPAETAPPDAKSAPAAKAKTVTEPGAGKTGPAGMTPPLPGYDDLSLASLRARLRGLDAAEIQATLAYEQAHARREPVITMLERRLAKVTAG